MTPFSALLSLSGLSQREAATFLGVANVTVDKWASGKRSPAPAVLMQMSDLIRAQDRAAAEALAFIAGQNPVPDKVEIGYPADDYEAQGLGFPSVRAWGAMVGRIIAGAETPIILIPRGSTPATAAAMDAKEGG